MNTFRRIGLTAGSVAVMLGAGITPALASVAPAGVKVVSASPTASYDCYGFHKVNDNHRWEGGCYVYSGEIRTITTCDDRTSRVGGWIGARENPWFVYGECAPARVAQNDFQIDQR
ncbi:hypothetical protein [Amycolatopsis sp. WGS_07]|uniref:hypothetical protein n=1 Tax=Amycolatopsis sp. WGS_07 TaxID=3076764 RepID=UPI003872F0BD